MCLAIPGQILFIDESNPDLRMAKVSFAGVVKDICMEWLPDAGIGDFVLAHAGTALSKVDAEEAEITLNLFEQWAEGLPSQE